MFRSLNTRIQRPRRPRPLDLARRARLADRIWVIVWAVAGFVALVAGMVWGSKLGVQFSLAVLALYAFLSRAFDRLQESASPEAIAAAAVGSGCSAVAFTYNDPVIFLEYAVDTAVACREAGISTPAYVVARNEHDVERAAATGDLVTYAVVTGFILGYFLNGVHHFLD